MRKGLLLIVAACVAAIAFWAILASRSSTDAPAPPPRAGDMAKFTPAEAPGPAPDVRMLARDGEAFGLDAWRGQVVLLNFWATWCAPCVHEMPSLQRARAKLGGEGLEVVALSQDLKGWEVIDPFVERLGLDGLTVLHDPRGAAARALDVRGLPDTFLLGRDGRVLGRLTGPAEWDSPEAIALIRHYLDGETAR
jgi:peroxiredoxin